MAKRTVIYVPGIGDRRQGFNWLQQAFLATWLTYGFSGHLFIMDWRSSRPFSERFDELLERIDALHARGVEVSLVGASAGAATVLLALLARPDKLTGVATICGQIGGTAALHGPAAATNPRFRYSLASMQESVARLTESERRLVMTLRPRVDRIVPPHEAVLAGAVNYEMPVSGHMVGIGFGLLLEAPRIARFLREVATRPAR
jgi:pimeloyl-ACP methyl ester carboxylesterase